MDIQKWFMNIKNDYGYPQMIYGYPLLFMDIHKWIMDIH